MLLEHKLSLLIDAYALVKEKAEAAKKDAEDRNKEIKEIMAEFDIDNFSTDNYTAKVIIQRRESMHEDALIDVLQTSGYDEGIVKMKPYVDMDALESAIYHDEIPQEVQDKMSECVSVKEVQTLKITKNKGDKK